MTTAIELEKVRITFGTFTAVHDTNLDIRDGEFFSFLGPSGCGKTTLLRTISGFTEPSAGVVRIGGKDMAGIGPNKRPTALIFQNLALFPMMTVAENVAYGLRVRGVGKSEREQRAMKLLDQVALTPHAHKKISALSGGQKQRVAIARALAVEPKVLLLDEPLSALDLKLRQHMRRELREIQQRVGITFIYITHDQGEALNMSDRIAVMNAGHIEQVGTGREIYSKPQSAFVASFVGESNELPGKVSRISDGMCTVDTPLGALSGRVGGDFRVGDAATLFVRPEQLRLAAPGGDHAFRARVDDLSFEGSMTHLGLDTGLAQDCAATLMTSNHESLPEIGADLGLSFNPLDAIVLKSGAPAA
ncbi:ABC transporter ATP-binding protein [Salipiger abyssi]|uniref:ABC transporter ATP-binding protein n=1 Tax=Salipiger abyssi TaxID=1250539 RepID=UPI001A9099E4|nr:ABC transporter ATP-binding protein [Salipiger abyssi]MBN9887904.1 ABC transporter ATP-binding protein [Salipiger abyssi]